MLDNSVLKNSSMTIRLRSKTKKKKTTKTQTNKQTTIKCNKNRPMKYLSRLQRHVTCHELNKK